MEVDEIQRKVCKFQRVSSNGSTTTTDNSSNPQKIATSRGNLEIQNHVGVGVGVGVGAGGGGIDVMVGGGGIARLCGWPSSRIVRVSRASGGKDRHSKVLTSKGLRDRRVRLSVGTAIQFYDLQDRLGYDQPSKAVEWLLKAASSSIDELPSLDLPIAGGISDHCYHHQMSNEKRTMVNRNNLEDRVYQQQNGSNTVSQAKSPVCSSTSETSKGSELSLSRSENRVKARERARELTSKKEKEKEKEIDSIRVTASNQMNIVTENSSFTDLLTGGINTTLRSPMDQCILNRQAQTSQQLFQIPQFNITTTGDNNLHHYSILQDCFLPVGGGERHSLNFSMTSPSSSSGGVAPGGYTRGTLQSNLPSTTFLPHHHHHLQRFQSSSLDGSNLPFFIVPNSDHFQSAGGYHLSYGGGGGAGDHQKDKAKN